MKIKIFTQVFKGLDQTASLARSCLALPGLQCCIPLLATGMLPFLRAAFITHELSQENVFSYSQFSWLDALSEKHCTASQH